MYFFPGKTNIATVFEIYGKNHLYKDFETEVLQILLPFSNNLKRYLSISYDSNIQQIISVRYENNKFIYNSVVYIKMSTT